jgi:oxygen-dependent protoporphyrinogen oxidase
MRDMELTYGGLFRAMLGKRREAKRAGVQSGGPAGPAGVLTTLRGGVGRFTDALRDSLAAEVREGVAVQALERDGEGFALRLDGGARECFDAVVMAAPAHAAAEIVADLSSRASRALSEIEFANVAVVCSVYDPSRLGRELDGFGHLIPRRDGIRSLGCLWTSAIFPQQTSGEVLLRTILGGATDQGILDLDDDELLEVVRADTRTTLGIEASPTQSWVFRHPHGIAQYNMGHRDRVAEADRLSSELPGLAFVGASYRGVALNRCVRDAYTIAPRVLEPYGVRAPAIPDGKAQPE